MPARINNEEIQRLEDDRLGKQPWRRWGPYMSERQWGTVREDYSANGDAWNCFPFEMAASRAYRWGEDGIAGFCDEEQRLCLALALWNGRDSFLKERLFGLTNGQGNHGEDVKELYYYLDATPTHSYLKFLYKYPQRAFPYNVLYEENRRRGKDQPEYEILDTGIFDEDRYFDVFVEYARPTPDDVLVQVIVNNRGPDPAEIHVLPQIWFRNTWSWKPGATRPELALTSGGVIEARHATLGTYWFSGDDRPQYLFCDNDTNHQRLYGRDSPGAYYKDGLHDYVIHRQTDAVNPRHIGTKAAAYYQQTIAPQESACFRLRLTNSSTVKPFYRFNDMMAKRRQEADAFYADLQKELPAADARAIQRQALAGMIWNKQYYYFDVSEWLHGDPGQPPPPPPERWHGRDSDWQHLNTAEVLSMPDKWEYPWFAAWDLAFHCIAMALVDAEFAKSQLVLLAREWYMHPNGQIPAYEWGFGDVNPPVHAWAAWRVFQIDRKNRGDGGDIAFLERVFHKLLLNFTWWVNRKDAQGRNIFQGGFLGMDNIGVFDRSSPLPTGGYINQADGTSWMAMYCLNLLRIALELALHNPVYQDVASKFFEHFLYIAKAMTNIGGDGQGVGLWDEGDEFYYDHLTLPDDRMIKLKVRSMVGLIPLFAVETLEPELLKRAPEFKYRLKWFLNYRPDLAGLVSRWNEPGRGERRLLSLLRGHRMKKLLKRMLDETEFLSDYGVRSLSRYHLDHPYTFQAGGKTLTVAYNPGDADSNLFGGNSNWRGPIWFPVNYLIIESLQKFHHYYGDDFKVECPTGSGRLLTLNEVAQELSRRLTRIFLRDESGRRPVYGDDARMRNDPHYRDYILFYEYFQGDSARGLGASHQTGWTGLVAKLLQPRQNNSSEEDEPAEVVKPDPVGKVRTIKTRMKQTANKKKEDKAQSAKRKRRG